jgi:hypothetical protein
MEGKMRSKIYTIVALCALGVGTATGAKTRSPELQALDDALPGTLINDPSKLDLSIYGAGVTSKSVKDASIPGGGAAMQIVIPKAGQTHFEIGANSALDTPVKKGQKIVVAFYARTIKAETADGKGKIHVRVQQNAAPYTGFADAAFDVGSEWTLLEAKGVSNIDAAAGAVNVGFMLSAAKQTVQIGQIIVVEGADSIKTVTKTTAPAANANANSNALMMPNLTGKGKAINQAESLQLWQSYGEGLTKGLVPAKNMPGGTATAINMSSLGKNVYDAGINIPIAEALTQGDVLTIAFVARTISAETDTGAGKVAIRVQHNKPPYNGFGDNVLNLGPNWKVYQLRTQAKIDVPAGEAVVALHLAGAKQSLEIGPVYVVNAGPPASQ